MTKPSLYTLFMTSLGLVLTSPSVVWWLLITGILRTLFSLPDPANESVASFPLIIVFLITTVATPVIYGFYYEKIDGSSTSLKNIARSHIVNYLVLLLRMYLPPLAIAILPGVLNPQAYHPGYFHLTLVFFSLLYLYVIPTYYHSGSQRGAIGSGIQTLLQNLTISTPLLLILLGLETTILLSHLYHEEIITRSTQFFLVVDFGVYFIASLIDFVLFVILVTLLKSYDTPDEPDT